VELYKQINDCYDLGADIAKIVTLSVSASDNVRLLSLYSVNKPLVAFGMGDAGKITRIMAPFLGAEFTFASMDDGYETAAGQIPYSRMKALLSFLKEELKK
jgi:3-dehydroquinate dehydratase type I